VRLCPFFPFATFQVYFPPRHLFPISYQPSSYSQVDKLILIALLGKLRRKRKRRRKIRKIRKKIKDPSRHKSGYLLHLVALQGAKKKE
jgi:hypothetical protein